MIPKVSKTISSRKKGSFMAPNSEESTVPPIDWNVPDWRDESAYPKDEGTGLAQWKWEFLRRRPDYRQDWLVYAPKGYAQEMKEYEDHPFYDMKVGTKTLRLKNEPPLPLDDLNRTVNIPDCIKTKYWIPFLINPKNPNPETLNVFRYARPVLDDWTFPGDDRETNVFGLNVFLSKTEVALLFDLSSIPIEQQMAELKKKFPFEMSISDSPGDSRTFQNLPELLLWPNEEELSDVKKRRKPHRPRIIDHPKREDHSIVIFNFAFNYEQQWEFVKTELKSRQKPYALPKRRKRPEAWTNLLRVLDARELDVPFWEIGKVVYGYENDEDKFKANPVAREAFLDAKRIRDHFPD